MIHDFKKQMIRQSRVVLLTVSIAASIIIYTCLSAQTYDSNLSKESAEFGVIDFSGVTDKGSDARVTFTVSAEVVEYSSATLSESTEVVSDDGILRRLGLSVSPPRLVFEGDLKTSTLTLTNIGELETVYHIELVNTLIDEEGNRTRFNEEKLSETKQQGAMFAHRMLKFAPRVIRLKPQEQQTIRVAVRAPQKLDDGEYRSELSFSWQADAEEVTSLEKLSDQLASTSAVPATDSEDLKGEYARSAEEIYVPVIVRTGELAANGKLAELQLESSGEKTTLNLKIIREGNRSINGDLLIYGLNQQNEKSGLLQTVRRIAVYPPTAQHTVSVDITEAVNKAGDEIDSLLIEYKASSDEGSAVIDSAEIKMLAGARVSADK
ncbi:MAG: hypothetical protein ACD_39C01627G0001 [uncultured bacterium]|nr:MAG: hypothetical protein ACD_39C01627G0001 [uncultured bacterium]